MNKLKNIAKRIIIIYVILFIILGSSSSVYAKRGYDAQCGEFVSQYARDFIKKYCTPESKTRYAGIAEAEWSGGSFGQGTFICCCTAGVKYMYELALNVNLYDLGFDPVCANGIVNMPGSPNWVEVSSESDLQPGDVVINDHHTELYVGESQRANYGNSPYSGVIREGPSLSSSGGSFTKAFRLDKSVQVEPSGNVPTSTTNFGGTPVNYSEFYFNGIPDGKYSLANRKNIFELLVNSIKELVNFFTGLITYLFRGLVIGIISIFDRFINNTVKSINESPTTIQESGVSATSADDPYSLDRSVTIESLVFGDVDIFDINIFDAE